MNLNKFFEKHGFWKGLGIIKRHSILKLIYEPIKLKRKWITINGYKLLLDFKTGGISKGLYVMNSREILETEVMKKSLEENDVCLEAGANIGYYAFLEAKKKGTIIYAFEPDKRNTTILKEGIKKNNFENIQIYRKALSNIIGKQELYISSESNVNSMVKGHENYNGKVEMVETETIDNFFKDRKVDFIRMDVEGFEYEIFDGMKKLIKSKKPLKIMVEFHSDKYSKSRNFPKKLRELKENGFKCKYIITQELPLQDLMEELGYEPEKVINDFPNTRALYKNIDIDDLSDLIKRGNIIRAGLFKR